MDEFYDESNQTPTKKKKKSKKRKHESDQEEEEQRLNDVGKEQTDDEQSKDEQPNEDDNLGEQIDDKDEEDGQMNKTVDHSSTTYVSEPFSCIEHLHKQIKFPVLPIAINQELKVIKQTLIHKWKYRFINELNGFLYYFDNLNVIESDYVQIMDDLPFVYFNLTADFYVFRPKVGDYLKSKISWLVVFTF